MRMPQRSYEACWPLVSENRLLSGHSASFLLLMHLRSWWTFHTRNSINWLLGNVLWSWLKLLSPTALPPGPLFCALSSQQQDAPKGFLSASGMCHPQPLPRLFTWSSPSCHLALAQMQLSQRVSHQPKHLKHQTCLLSTYFLVFPQQDWSPPTTNMASCLMCVDFLSTH